LTFSNTRSGGGSPSFAFSAACRRQVLELLAERMRNKEIAAALNISGDTTGMHVKNIYTKPDVHDRTAAVAKAIRRGIIRLQDRGTWGRL
jgi:DNA-binding CsgD family transcriptional regulator